MLILPGNTWHVNWLLVKDSKQPSTQIALTTTSPQRATFLLIYIIYKDQINIPLAIIKIQIME